MKGISGSTNKNSWQYWANIHKNYCPHGIAYFLAWHRGYISYFEQQLRVVLGYDKLDSAKLMLPYWDYYTYPTLPEDFTNAASNNPLYTRRVNTSAYPALSMSPFATGVNNFQLGLNNAFEPNLESAPHDPVHDIIGGYLADITTAALDPIFYLHHCNLDRLWNAWSRRSTSKVPAATSSYWNGTFTYASNLTMARALTRTTAGLLYDYADDTMPVKMPQQAQHGRIVRVQAQNSSIHGRPKLRTFTSSAPRTVSSTRDSLGGLVGIPLDNNSISAGITLQTAGANSLRDVLATSPAAVLSDSASSAADLQPQAQSPTPSQGSGEAKKSFQHVKLVLDGLRSASTAGQDGGYFYNIYLNLPSTGDVDSVSASHFVGTVGAFEVSVAAHHGNGKKEFDITYPLASLGLTNPNQMVVSFVRENGLVYPSGNVVSMNEMRLELSTD